MIVIYSGNWERFCLAEAGNTNADCLGSLYYTQKEMSNAGYEFVKFNENAIAFTNDANVINGIRIAVMESKRTDVLFRYFPSFDYDAIDIPINSNGVLAEWPSGFCDQSMYDIRKLIRGRN